MFVCGRVVGERKEDIRNVIIDIGYVEAVLIGFENGQGFFE
jgi:hypothetical protein